MGTPIVVEFLPEDQLCIVVTTVGEVLQWCLVDDSVSLYHYYCCSISFQDSLNLHCHCCANSVCNDFLPGKTSVIVLKHWILNEKVNPSGFFWNWIKCMPSMTCPVNVLSMRVFTKNSTLQCTNCVFLPEWDYPLHKCVYL